MTSRRNFIASTMTGIGGVSLSTLAGGDFSQNTDADPGEVTKPISKNKRIMNDQRPSSRRFVSQAIENKITSLTSRMKDPDLAKLFTNCFRST